MQCKKNAFQTNDVSFKRMQKYIKPQIFTITKKYIFY